MFIISRPLLKQLWLSLVASLAFFIIGMVRGYSASAIPSMEILDPELIQTSEQKSWIGSIPPLGAFTGSLASGKVMQALGRRRALQLTAPAWLGAWLLLGFGGILPLLLLGRFLTGVCVGLVLAPGQVYVSECCNPEIRGRLGSMPSIAMCLGILVSYVTGNWLNWRHLALFSGLFCVALFVFLLPLPESPVWLEAHGADASQAVKWLQLSAHATDRDPNKEDDKDSSLFNREVFFSARVLKPLTIVIVLLIFQQFSGIDAVIFFTVEIFKSAGSALAPGWAAVVVGVVQALGAVGAAAAADGTGRRLPLLASAATCAAANAAMGAAFYFRVDNHPWLGYLPIGSLVVFVAGYSLGLGALPFVLLGELFPARHRAPLAALAGALNLLSMFAVIKSYHALESVMTSAGTFWMYSCFCVLAFMFVLFAVPETKGKSLAEIEQHFRGNKGHTVNKQTVTTPC
ncbi:hypothetical protein ACJJTC_015118 [Scirpophaga incertulas]